MPIISFIFIIHEPFYAEKKCLTCNWLLNSQSLEEIIFMLRRIAGTVCWLTGTASWLTGTASWLTGTVSWLTGIVSWLTGTVSWLTGIVSWLTGSVAWLTGRVAWVTGTVSWLTGTVSWLTGTVAWLTSTWPWLTNTWPCRRRRPRPGGWWWSAWCTQTGRPAGAGVAPQTAPHRKRTPSPAGPPLVPPAAQGPRPQKHPGKEEKSDHHPAHQHTGTKLRPNLTMCEISLTSLFCKH